MTKCLSCGYEAEGEPKFCPQCGAKFGATPTGRGDSLVGQILSSKYRLVSELGKGGMGTVYLAEHTGLKKQIALKVLHPDLQVSEESMQRFQREGIAAGQLGHAGAIQIFDFDKDESGLLYLAMEFVEGVDLKTLVRRERGLEPARAIDITRQVLEVLAQAHKQGIVHRDLKPDNIMVLPGDGNAQDRVKVLDFGLSKLIDTPLDSSLMTQTGRIMGTPLYMSPEQCSGLEVDSRSDIYAVGLILHEMIAGTPTFSGDSIPEILVKHTSADPPALAEVRPGISLPAGLEDLLDGALAKDRSERFQNAEDMLEQLSELRLDQLQSARKPKRKRSPGDRAPWMTALAGAGGLALLLGGGYLVSQWLGGGSSQPMFLSQRAPDALSLDEARYVRDLEEARGALLEGSLDVALSAVEDARSKKSRDAESYLVRAAIHRARGQADLAEADLREALVEVPSYAAAQAELGWLALDENEVADASAAFEEALEMDAECAAALAGRGELMRMAGKQGQARADFEAAVSFDPDLVFAHRALGTMALEQGEFEAARDAFIAARRRVPKDGLAAQGLGEAYLGLEERGNAERELARAVELQPDNQEARLLLGTLLLADGRGREARELLIDGEGQGDLLQVVLGAAHASEDDPARALTSLRNAEAAVPAGLGDLLLAQLELEEGSAERALECSQRATAGLTEPGLRAMAQFNSGLAHLRLEQYGEALTQLRAAREATPEDLFLLLTLGWVEMDWGDPELARQHLERYRDLGGSDDRVPRWLDRLGAR